MFIFSIVTYCLAAICGWAAMAIMLIFAANLYAVFNPMAPIQFEWQIVIASTATIYFALTLCIDYFKKKWSTQEHATPRIRRLFSMLWPLSTFGGFLKAVGTIPIINLVALALAAVVFIPQTALFKILDLEKFIVERRRSK